MDSLNQLSDRVMTNDKNSILKKETQHLTKEQGIDQKQMDEVLTNSEFTNPILKRFMSTKKKFSTRLDRETTIKFLHVDPNIVKFIHEGMITKKEAYQSQLVSQLRFLFIAKNVLYQIMLQTLPFNPLVQLFMMISIEFLYVVSTAWKYAAVKHFVKGSSLVYIIIQGALMLIFLFLVFAMSFKGYKYGNSSTKDSYDRN
jgi:uncharacterized membrane protein